MTHDLLHGDLSAAAVDNVFLLVGLPLLALWSLWRVRPRPAGVHTGGDHASSPSWRVVWTIVRNLPGFPAGSHNGRFLATDRDYAQAS